MKFKESKERERRREKLMERKEELSAKIREKYIDRGMSIPEIVKSYHGTLNESTIRAILAKAAK